MKSIGLADGRARGNEGEWVTPIPNIEESECSQDTRKFCACILLGSIWPAATSSTIPRVT